MSDTPDPSGTIRLRTDRISFVEVDGRQLILDSRRSVYYAVNATGLHLWSALRKGTTEAELRRMLIEDHGADEGEAGADIAKFLKQLDDHGLLTRSPLPLMS
jgi:Coenzyme PQQ synthesis protein D (PqqD)